MTKNLIKSIAIALVFVPMVVFAQTPAASPASIPVSDSGSTAGPSTGDSSATVTSASTGGSTSTAGPSTGNSTGTASNTSTGGSTSTAGPSTGGSSSTASDTILPTPTATPTPPPVIPPTGGNGGNGGGSTNTGGSSSSSGSRVAYPYACNQFTTFMRYGYNNDKTQVIKLQTFLRDAEKLSITVNGIFDKQTENAVIAFQNKYSGTVMGPWGASQGSGYVYITTIKQINKIACSIPLALNPQELAIINNYKNKRGIASAVIVTPKAETAPVKIETRTEDNTITFTSTEEPVETNTANVNKASIMNRFLNFLVYLFK